MSLNQPLNLQMFKAELKKTQAACLHQDCPATYLPLLPLYKDADIAASMQQSARIRL